MNKCSSDNVLLGPALKQFSLEDEVAVVTGAGSGLGKEVAVGFAHAGAKVVLIDNNADAVNAVKEHLEKDGYDTLALQLDVTDSDSVKNSVKKVIDNYDRIDVLVNCAGITRRMPAEDFNENDWDMVLNVNLKGTFLLSKHVGRQMLEREKGSIVNFGSLGSLVAIPNSIAYCASKGGVAQLTKTMAVEWAQKGVRVNAIIPGTFETPLLMECIENDPEYGQRMLSRFPMGRFAKPQEIVGACIFLASSASSYVTGHLLCVDGGCIAF